MCSLTTIPLMTSNGFLTRAMLVGIIAKRLSVLLSVSDPSGSGSVISFNQRSKRSYVESCRVVENTPDTKSERAGEQPYPHEMYI